MKTMITSWQRRRSEFNHDWLKNHFMPALAKFLNLLDGRIEDVAFERVFVLSVLTEWETHGESALALVREFEQEMSPRRLLDYPPLSRCDDESRRWLAELAHALWLSRYPIRRWTSEACGFVRRANAAYAQLHEVLQHCADRSSAAALRPYRIYFEAFCASCDELAGAIEKLINDIKVT